MVDESVQSGEVAIQGYSLYRTDRDGRTRGGSCIYIRSNIPANPILQYSNGMVETTVIKVPIWNMVIGAIYRPPNTTIDKWKDALNRISTVIENVQNSTDCQEVILAGDMNFADTIWEDMNGGVNSGNNQSSEILGIMNKFFLT